MRNNIDSYKCRICGYLNAEQPWGADGLTPNFDICPCCGVEFGYEDATPKAILNYRSKWLAKGAPWGNKGAMPEGWDLDQQLAGIPKKFC